jgi:4-hydroxybenzoate polyprenyltransferase
MLSPKTKLLLSVIFITVVLTLVFGLTGLPFPVGGYSLYIVVFVIAVLFYATLSKLADKLKKKRL